MSNNRINSLNVEGKDRILKTEPDFDLYKVREVLKITIVPTRQGPTIGIDFAYHGRMMSVLSVEFLRVSRFRIPEHFALFSVSELEIADIKSAGLENVRYEIISHTGRRLIVQCHDIRFFELIPIGDTTYETPD